VFFSLCCPFLKLKHGFLHSFFACIEKQPLENQIFFGRPSPELALKMLREGGQEDLRTKTHWEEPPSMDDDVDVLKKFVASCLEKTAITHEEELPAGDPFSCIWHGSGDTEECYFE
jgi:hypothetical protein